MIMVGALTAGLSFPQLAPTLKPFMIWILAIVMLFSTSGISFNVFKDVKKAMLTTLNSIMLNYVLFGIVLMALAFMIFDDPDIINGFIVIAASPPGIVVIPFSIIYKGDLNYSLIGILGAYIASIFISPTVLSLLSNGVDLDVTRIIQTIVIIVVIPLLLSRLLRIKKIYPTAEKMRGRVVDFGFATIVYTSVGLNQQLLFSNFSIIIYTSIILFTSIFILGLAYSRIRNKQISRPLNISHNLMLTLKSSGFSAATAISLFPAKAAIPAAVLSVFVLLYLIFADSWIPQKSPLHKLIFKKE